MYLFTFWWRVRGEDHSLSKLLNINIRLLASCQLAYLRVRVVLKHLAQRLDTGELFISSEQLPGNQWSLQEVNAAASQEIVRHITQAKWQFVIFTRPFCADLTNKI